MKLHNGRRYVAFLAGAALFWPVLDAVLTASTHRGFDPPFPHPFEHGVWVVDRDVMSERGWSDLSKKFPDTIFALTWIFLTSGTSHTLESDFNTLSNQINAIGSGTGGFSGAPATGGCNFVNGDGGAGGAGGAFSQIVNYAGHTAGQSVNIQVGTSDTSFDSTAVLFAKAASGSTGGQAASGVGTTKFSGGNGGSGGSHLLGGSGGGGGGGGAAGPHGAGNNGANGGNATSVAPGGGGAGATGDAGNTAAGANGSQFGPNASSQFDGSGGGGAGGAGVPSGPNNGNPGSSGGFFGGGGGGGGGGATNCAILGSGGAGGGGTQGLIAYSYTPVAGSGARSFGFIIG